jgi:hypothetical protein
MTAPPRRTQIRRSASCAGSGSRSGVSSKTSPARANTSASITSDLFLALIAPRGRAAWREPSKLSCPPASDNATAKGSQVIEVGSATATAPGYSASLLVSIDNPANVGGTENSLVTATPRRSSWRTHTWWCAVIAASMPMCAPDNPAGLTRRGVTS